jgi:hypothetical protein
MRLGILLGLLTLATAFADELPLVTNVEHQPLGAQVTRILTALDLLGDGLPAAEVAELNKLANADADPKGSVSRIQKIMDPHCLLGVMITPEGVLKAQRGPAKPELMEQGWRTFLVKVHNQGGLNAALAIDSPNAGQMANSPAAAMLFLDIQVFTKQPLKPFLSGLELEYRIVQLYCRDSREHQGRLIVGSGQPTDMQMDVRRMQGAGAPNTVDFHFTSKPAVQVKLRVLDFDDKPTTGSFLIRDTKGRIYPSPTKRLAPDFFFQKQVYRADGESVALPPGDYTVQYTRGPEYLRKQQTLHVDDKPMEVTFRLERWIDPAKFGYFSGDHHIHAAGCAHYEKPTEGVFPEDMMRHIVGEDLKVGNVLTWGPGWYFQKTFFEGKDNAVSTKDYLIRYDVEVSGFPSSHTGHICLLGLKDQDYPGSKRIEDWPSWGIPIFKWAKAQEAVTGFAHSGSGLALQEEKLLSYEMPKFDGIGANEFIVGVTQELVDFISTVDTPYVNELNIWYHTLNVGYRTRISGETDFPCISGERVGEGRSYVKQRKAFDYRDWATGIRDGRNYVSDGKSHLFDFKVNDVEMGFNGSELKLQDARPVHITARAAVWIDGSPGENIRERPYTQKPYWDSERARIGNTRRCRWN